MHLLMNKLITNSYDDFSFLPIELKILNVRKIRDIVKSFNSHF